MDDQTRTAARWTADRVEGRLIDAFRALPSHPVFSDRARIRPALGDSSSQTGALNWPARFVPDRSDGLALLTWARCRAMGESVRERYRALGWSRTTAECRRRRALARIVASLNSEQTGLDSGTKRPGACERIEAAPVLADA